jgi:hypothetical protein
MADFFEVLNVNRTAFGALLLAFGAAFSGTSCEAPGTPPSVLWPADGAVLPRALAALDLGVRPAAGAVRIRLRGGDASLTLQAANGRAHLDGAALAPLLEGETLEATLEDDAGRTSTAVWPVTDAPLPFEVFVWAGDDAQLLRARVQDATPTTFAIGLAEDDPDAPERPLERGCRKCHALAAAAPRMAFTYFSTEGPGGVTDLDTPASPLVDNDDGVRFSFSALTPDGAWLVATVGTRLSLLDAATGEVVREDLAGRSASQPSISSDGRLLAFVGDLAYAGGPPGGALDFDQSALFVGELAGDPPALLDVRQLAAPTGEAWTYPTFSPDGRLVVASRGPWSRSSRDDEPVRSTLFALPVDGGEHIPLLSAAPEGLAWMPSFAPQSASGWFWLTFVSRRPLDPGSPASPPQVWLAAIDPGAADGEDPSAPAVRLPAFSEAETHFFPRLRQLDPPAPESD